RGQGVFDPHEIGYVRPQRAQELQLLGSRSSIWGGRERRRGLALGGRRARPRRACHRRARRVRIHRRLPIGARRSARSSALGEGRHVRPPSRTPLAGAPGLPPPAPPPDRPPPPPPPPPPAPPPA